MKKLIHILTIILSVSTFACQQNKDYPEAIQRAESCMDTHPDSALHYLSAYADSIGTQPEEIRMYYHLLTHQAKDKLYMKPTSDSLINRIVAFYDETDDKDKQMLAYYYQGSVYRDLNDAPRALKAFQQVLQLGEGYPPCDLFARTYNQMGTLFAHQGLYNESLEANKKAAEQFILQEKKNRTSYALRDIARMYDVKEQRDSALHYYQRAYQAAVSANDSNRMNHILGEMGCFLTHDSATRETGKQILRSLISQGKEYPNILSCLGSLYRHEQKWDSAYHFLNKMKTTSDIKRRHKAYQDLFLIESQKGNYALANRYSLQANALRDSIDQMTQTEAIAKVQSLYQYQHTEQENYRLKEANAQKLFFIYILAAILTISIAITVAYYFYIKQRQETAARQAERIKELEEKRYAQSQEAMEENQKKIETLEMELLAKDNHINELERQRKQAQKASLEITNQQIEAAKTEQELRIRGLQQSHIYLHFHNACHDSGINLTDNDWVELAKAINEAYPNFSEKLYTYCPKISTMELNICCLIKISIPTSDIATLVRRSRSAVTLARTRLFKKMHGKEGKAEELDRFILDL